MKALHVRRFERRATRSYALLRKLQEQCIPEAIARRMNHDRRRALGLFISLLSQQMETAHMECWLTTWWKPLTMARIGSAPSGVVKDLFSLFCCNVRCRLDTGLELDLSSRLRLGNLPRCGLGPICQRKNGPPFPQQPHVREMCRDSDLRCEHSVPCRKF